MITAWNISNASQQVLVIRDGGTYLNAGKWVASHGTLEVRPFTGPFAGTSGLTASSAGMSRSGDHLDFTLEHMVPVLLAEAQNLGGDHLMYATVPILGGAALLAFYLFARRVLRYPVAALGAMLGLGLLMPQVSFSRDSTTEIPMQVLLFSAAWMLCDRRTLRHRGTAFTAGLFLGLLQAMHIDGLAFVIGVPFAGLCWWFRARREERPEVARSLLWTAFGVAVGVALGFLDLLHRSPHYFRTLHFDVERLAAVALLAVGAAIGIALMSRVWSQRAPEWRRARGAGRPPRGNPGVGGRLRRLARTPGAADRARAPAEQRRRHGAALDSSHARPDPPLFRAFLGLDELVPRADHAHAGHHRRRARDPRVRARHPSSAESGRRGDPGAAGAVVSLATEHHAGSDLGDAALPARRVAVARARGVRHVVRAGRVPNRVSVRRTRVGS